MTFDLTIVKPLARQYSDWTLTNLAKEAERQTPAGMEEIRLMRALYRFQACCNLFGVSARDISQQLKSADLLESFISSFEPSGR